MTTRKRPQKISANHPTMEILSKNLREVMEARGITQKDLEALSKEHGGISQKTISNILRQVRSIYLEQLDVLADTFQVTPAELISENFNPRSVLKMKSSSRQQGLSPQILRIAKKLQALPDGTRETMIGLIQGFSVAGIELSKAKNRK